MHDDMELHVEGEQFSSAYWRERIPRLVDKAFALVDDLHAAFQEFCAAEERERSQAMEPKLN